MQAALTPPADPGNDAAAYMQIAKGALHDGHYGGPGQASPNDWSPGAPLLYGAVYYLTGGVHVKAALLLARAARAPARSCSPTCSRAASPARSPA